jgi:hypothetical protein
LVYRQGTGIRIRPRDETRTCGKDPSGDIKGIQTPGCSLQAGAIRGCGFLNSFVFKKLLRLIMRFSMSETITRSTAESAPDIRIMRLKGKITPQTHESIVIYTVYFELSITPPLAWKNLFDGEWLRLKPLSSSGRCLDAKVEGGFLVIRCPLQEIAGVHLPFLKMAVAATNNKYRE